jgi:hypothetical protein
VHPPTRNAWRLLPTALIVLAAIAIGVLLALAT